MIRRISAFLLMALAAPIAAQPTQASLETSSSAALNLFERDWVLMNWALKFYDADGDILLEPSEAQAAADEFRKLADKNGDGRVTPDEYRVARDLILSRG
jgi:hypothetical protein